MKLQTSVEFIAILSAVIAFATFVIAMYMHLASSQNQAMNSISELGSTNVIFSNATTVDNRSTVTAAIPSFPYVGKSNAGYIITAIPEKARILSISIENSIGVDITPSSYSDLPGGSQILDFSLFPESSGSIALSVNALIQANNTMQWINGTYNAYAVYQNQSSTNQSTALQAIISRRNESVAYALSTPQNVGSYYVWFHCPAHDWVWGYILPEPAQCGPNTWGFIINGNCDQNDAVGWDNYMCVRVNSTNQSVSTVSQAYHKNYSIGVSLYNASLKLHANLTSNVNSSLVESQNGSVFGNAIVQSVSGDGYLPEPASSLVLLDNGSSSFMVNSSYYGSYETVATSLIQNLKAYNGSWIQQGQQELVSSLANDTNKAQKALVSALPAKEDGCGVIGSSYVCTPFSQFYYSIWVFPANSFKVANQSINTGGSTVQIR